MTEPDDPTLAHVDGRRETGAAAQMRALPYYPHTAMNEPAAKLAQRVKGLLGGDNHVITRPEIDRVVALLDKAIAEMGGQLGAS